MLKEMTQTSCTKRQCFSSKRCVGTWLISLNCGSDDSRNSAVDLWYPFLALEK